MSDESRETSKKEEIDRIDISAPRPTDEKNLNSSDDRDSTNIQRNSAEKDDE